MTLRQRKEYKLLRDELFRRRNNGEQHLVFSLMQDSVTRGNSKKIFKLRARLNLCKYAFSYQVVNNWNALPEWVVASESVQKFEANFR